MSVGHALARFKPSESLFRCPLCTRGMAFRNENSLACFSGHCFDLSKHGYLQFAPHQKALKYSKTLYESRRAVFQAGLYHPFLAALGTCLENRFVKLLDAGCGEGFFTSSLPGDVYALDIAKEAVLLAAKANRTVKWMVGDLARIPLQSESMDACLNILAPANYREFLRVLRPNGRLYKAAPGKQYFRELRECAGEHLADKAHSGEKVLRLFKENTDFIEQIHVCNRFPVPPMLKEHLARMSPLLFHVDPSALDMDALTHITIDVTIMVGQKKT